MDNDQPVFLKLLLAVIDDIIDLAHLDIIAKALRGFRTVTTTVAHNWYQFG
jgi:hypothetical protein